MEVRAYLSAIMAVTIIAGAAVIVELVAYNPTALGPVGVTVWFLGLFLALQGGMTLGLYRLKRRYQDVISPTKRFMSSWRQGLIIGGTTVILLALSSLRQLSLRDAGLLALLGLLIEFYGRTRKW